MKRGDISTTAQAYANARQVAYELPYFIKKKVGKVWVEHLISEMQDIEQNGTMEQKRALHDEIEKAYLEKEIARMYDRLAKAGRDTAVVSDKLTKLKNSRSKKSS